MTVYVVGSVNIDERLAVHRIPRPGETVTAASSAAALGGKGANQAVAAAAAGARTILVAAIGDDVPGRSAIAALGEAGVETERVRTDTEAGTGRAVVMVDDAGENAIVVVAGANRRLAASDAERALGDLAPGDVVVMQNEVPPEANHAAAGAARRAGATSIWNAAPSPSRRTDVVAADIVVVNTHELRDIAQLVGATDAGGGTSAQTAAVARLLGATVVCTRGADGIVHASPDGNAGSVPSLAVDVVDTTGAGDATVGYLAASVHRPLPDALRIAATAGALTVTRPGAAASIPGRGDVAAAAHT